MRPSAAETVAGLWAAVGGAAEALDTLDLPERAPVLPSAFRVDLAAQVSIALVALAAADIRVARGGRRQQIRVDPRAAAIECRSERYLRIDGQPAPPLWDPIAGLYPTAAGGFVRLHTNFPHHRGAILRLLGCEPTREAVSAALADRDAVDFETLANADGAVVAALRRAEIWAAHPQARAIAALPLVSIERIGDAPPRPLPAGSARPLAGWRVLDLTRIIAGPVAGRALAAHGATVMRIAGPHLPFIDWLVKDTGRGKLSAFCDLTTAEGRAALDRLAADADIFLQAYRPGALAARGFAPEDLAARHPGIVCASLSAYGHTGPWAGRRGFDSLVQTATGFNHAEGAAAGIGRPKELPAQILDHASGYLLALGAQMARLRQARDGGSWLVRVSLARTGRWLWDLGQDSAGLTAADPDLAAVEDLLEDGVSAWGPTRAVRHAAEMSDTPPCWVRPAVALGTHPAVWPD